MPAPPSGTTTTVPVDDVDHRVDGGTEAVAPLGDDHRRTDQLRHRTELVVIGGLQGVRDADRHRRHARGVAGEREEEVIQRVARQQHDRTIGGGPEVEQTPGQRIGRATRLAVGQLLPPAGDLRRGGEHGIRRGLGPASQLLAEVLGVRTELGGGPEQDRAVGPALRRDPRPGERVCGSHDQSVTSTTTAAPVSPAAHPVKSPDPPPRNRNVSISSAIDRSPVGPCGWPKTRLQP